MLIDTSSRKWFAVQVVPNREQLAATLLSYKGYELFLPALRGACTVRQRPFRPLFPGYLFCRIGFEVAGLMLTTPGVLRIVGVGRQPLPVDDSEIENIRHLEDSGVAAERCPFPDVGQEVSIVNGPLAGLHGLLVSRDRRDWIVVSITLLRRSVCVRMRGDWVVALRPAGGLTNVFLRAKIA